MIKIRKSSLYLSCLLITVGVISNVLSLKVLSFELMGKTFTASGSVPFFVLMLVISNVLTDTEGSQFTTSITKLNFFCVLASVAMLRVVADLPAAPDSASVNFSDIFSGSYKFLVAGLIAYIGSIRTQMVLFEFLRRRWRGACMSASHFFSTSIALLVDVTLFTLIGYYIGMGWYSYGDGVSRWLNIIIGQYSVQLLMSVISIPIFKLISAYSKSSAIVNKEFKK